MATRRRGGADLDDLKARLGYAGSPSKAEEAEAPADAESSAAETEDAGTAEAADAPAAAPAATPEPHAPVAEEAPSAPAPPAAAAASEAMPYGEDYANAVSELESAAPVVLDANAVDPELKAPNNTLTGVLIAAVVALLVGVAFGAVGSTSNQARKIANAMTQEADAAAAVIRPNATKLSELNGRVADLEVSALQPDFQTFLSEAYAAGDLALSPVQLTGFSTLMSFDEAASRDLLSYAVGTNHLSSLVTTHLALTERDSEELARLMEGRADTANYGVAIELERILASYQSFVEDPEANPFQPILAERVTYAGLDVRVEGDGDNQREFYDVRNSAGEEMPVLVHDLVLLEREQLLPPSTGETALDRYQARAEQIQALLLELTSAQAELLTRLEELGSRPTHAAL